MRYAIFLSLLVAVSSAVYADDGLNVALARITQAYNVDYQQKDIQKKLQFKDQIEKERLEIERNNTALSKAESQQGNGSTAFKRDNYRVLPSSCEKNQSGEFTCYMSNGNYYRVTQWSIGSRWQGFNDTQKTQWSGESTVQGVNATYSGIDAAGQADTAAASVTKNKIEQDSSLNVKGAWVSNWQPPTS
jgi:hypothetical protein